MIKRKTYDYLLTIVLFTFLVTVYFYIYETVMYESQFHFNYFVEFLGFVLLFSSILILLYGVPISFLSDFLTRKMLSKKRFLTAGMIHIFFGLSFVFLYMLIVAPDELFGRFNIFWDEASFYFYCSSLASIIFWLVDEWMRRVLIEKS